MGGNEPSDAVRVVNAVLTQVRRTGIVYVVCCVLGVGCWVLGVGALGCWGVGYWMMGCWGVGVLGIGVLGVGCWMLGVG